MGARSNGRINGRDVFPLSGREYGSFPPYLSSKPNLVGCPHLAWNRFHGTSDPQMNDQVTKIEISWFWEDLVWRLYIPRSRQI
jgi:hypothetical protein